MSAVFVGVKGLAILAGGLALLSLLVACSSQVAPTATPPATQFYQQPFQGPGGMMGPGMMGPGMMGPGTMGGWGGYNPNAEPLTLDQATEAVTRYVIAYGDDLEVKEVMEFQWNFYAEVEEASTDIHAMELLIDKYTGQVYPEMGPNMMWNTKYGMMAQTMGSYHGGGAPTAKMRASPEHAQTLAQQFLDASGTGLLAGAPDTFYGYYTLHTLRDGRVEGMLSVNGYSGQVWYHTWHGSFVQMKEIEH